MMDELTELSDLPVMRAPRRSREDELLDSLSREQLDELVAQARRIMASLDENDRARRWLNESQEPAF